MKRTISLIVSLIMCLGLAGCGNGQKPEIRVRTGSKNTSAEESTATTTVFEPDKEVIEKGEKQNNKIVVHMGDDTSSETDTSSSSKADSSSNSENSSNFCCNIGVALYNSDNIGRTWVENRYITPPTDKSDKIGDKIL